MTKNQSLTLHSLRNDLKKYWKILIYSQIWANGYLWITATCLQRPLFERPNFNYFNIPRLTLNNDHLSTTASVLGSQGWPLYTGLTVVSILFSWTNFYEDPLRSHLWDANILNTFSFNLFSCRQTHTYKP